MSRELCIPCLGSGQNAETFEACGSCGGSGFERPRPSSKCFGDPVELAEKAVAKVFGDNFPSWSGNTQGGSIVRLG